MSGQRLDWMYEGISGLVDEDDYLTGREVDQIFEIIQKEEESGHKLDTVTDSSVPSLLFGPVESENGQANLPKIELESGTDSSVPSLLSGPVESESGTHQPKIELESGTDSSVPSILCGPVESESGINQPKRDLESGTDSSAPSLLSGPVESENGATQPKIELESEGDDEDIIEVQDDREGCRSLVCDSNGIIVAEMVYRCMICANVAESISEAQKHYQIKHIGDEIEASPSKESKLPLPISNGTESHHSSDQEDYSFTSQEMPSFFNYGYPSGTSGFDDLDPTQFLSQSYIIQPSSKKIRTEPLASNGNGTGSSSRGGYVTCAVCDITKFYASVQRRYGQFTCMGCAKFFGRFLMKPRRYYCPNLGSCPLDQSPRCKACLLQACIRTYVIDEKRMKIVNANKPLKRMGPGGSKSSESPTPTAQAANSRTSKEASSKRESSLLASPIFPSEDVVHHARSKSSTLKEEKLNTSTVMNKKGNNSVSTTSSRHSPPKRSVGTAASKKSNNGTNPGRKVAGCRACSGCLAEDCGKCHYCLDKPKFGGGNTLKKKCVAKRCLMQGYKVKASDNFKKIKLTRK